MRAQVLWKCLTTYNTDNNVSVFPEPSSFQTTETSVPLTSDAKTLPSAIPNILQTIEEIEGENDEEIEGENDEEKEEKEVMATETEPDDPNIIQPETDIQEQEQMKKEDIKDGPINN